MRSLGNKMDQLRLLIEAQREYCEEHMAALPFPDDITALPAAWLSGRLETITEWEEEEKRDWIVCEGDTKGWRPGWESNHRDVTVVIEGGFDNMENMRHEREGEFEGHTEVASLGEGGTVLH